MGSSNSEQLNDVIKQLRERRQKTFLIVSVMVGLAVLTGVISLFASSLGILKGPYEAISRVQVSPLLFDVLQLPATDLKTALESVLIYVGYPEGIGWLLKSGFWLTVSAALVVIALVFLVMTELEKRWVADLAAVGMFVTGLLAILCGIIFVAAPGTIQGLVYQEGEVSTISVRKSRHIPREIGEKYNSLVSVLNEEKQKEGLYLPAQYALSQLALRVGADDAIEQSSTFLEAYESDPSRLGFKPVAQHLYAIEMAVYGEPRSVLANEYVQRRKSNQTPGAIAKLWPWVPITLFLLALPFIGLWMIFSNRVESLSKLIVTMSEHDKDARKPSRSAAGNGASPRSSGTQRSLNREYGNTNSSYSSERKNTADHHSMGISPYGFSSSVLSGDCANSAGGGSDSAGGGGGE